ncbi:MAG: hypothetical protein ISS74_03945 [Planctomycetes bacterium]|nr:hypothetical protein [Planctomycetota bacterium]
MLIATSDAVYELEKAGGTPGKRFEAPGIRRVAEGRHRALVALEDGRLALLKGGRPRYLEPDLGEGVEVTALLILAEDPLEVLLGTEPPHVYRLTVERGAERCGVFDALHVRSGWHTPWGGPPAVRSLAGTPDGTVYADIHVGSIMVSADRGTTWAPVTPDLNEDVHQVATCPAAPDRVYANTARAVHVSDDRGKTWQDRGGKLGRRYGRAIAVHPARPAVLLASTSDGPHGDNVHGGLFGTTNAGKTWSQVTDGFPAATRENIDTFHVAVTADGTGWASVGEALYTGQAASGPWRKAWEAPDAIRMLSVAP